MAARFPKEIKIGYSTFKIKHLAKKSIEKAGAFGDIEFNDPVINVYGNQTGYELTNSVWHEILHGVNYVFAIKFKNAREEERCVRHMANALTTVFRDNPKLLQWTMKNLKEKKEK